MPLRDPAADVDHHHKGNDTNMDGNNTSEDLPAAARQTWQWCADFVVPYGLCPWAAASVQTAGAVAIYLMDSSSSAAARHDDGDGDDDALTMAVRDVSRIFYDTVVVASRRRSTGDGGPDPVPGVTVHDARHTAISLVVDVSDRWRYDCEAFSEYFDEILDDFMEGKGEEEQQQDDNDNDITNQDDVATTTIADAVMWAPFHPDWHYGGGLDADDPLHLEKQSPHPTVSIVAQDVLDQAGPQATQRIAETNEITLRQFHLQEWKQRYQKAVYGNDNDDVAGSDHDDWKRKGLLP